MGRRDEDPLPPIEIWGDDHAAESTRVITTRSRPRRSRAWALALSAGVVALLLGGVVLDDDEPTTDGEAAGTEADESTTTDGTSTTTRPATTTTSEVLPGAPLLGAPSGLLLVTSPYNGAFSSRIIDLDTGEIRRVEVHVLAATEEGLLISEAGTVSLWPPPFDGLGATEIATIPVGQVLAETWVVDGGSLVWLLLRPPAQGAPGYPASAELVDLEGRNLAHLDIRDDLWPSGATDRGVVVSGPGGIYSIDPEGTVERISIGDLLAVAHNRVYVYSCDEHFECSIEALDGEGHWLDRQPSSHVQSSGPVGGIAAPDGRIASIEYHDMEGGKNKILVDGVPVFEASLTNNPTWSPDGRWLAIPDGAGIHLVDTRGDGELVFLEVGPTHNERQVFVQR